VDKKELAIIPINELQVMAQAACKSGLFQMPSPEAALTLMLLCQAEGLHPIQALRQYHIIKGRPAMRADAMQAAFQNAGGKIQWLERSDTKCSAEFSHPAGGTCTVTWSIETAKQAGLTGNPTWQKFPRAMLSARVVSEGCRAVYPAVVCGLYTPEEVQDFDDQPKTKKQGRQDVKNEPEDIIPVAATEHATVPTETPAITLAEKVKTVEPEFVPDEIVISYTATQDIKLGDLVRIETCDDVCVGISLENIKKGEIGKVRLSGRIAPVPEAKAAERPAKAGKPAGDVAAEIKQVRALAQAYGCKTVEQFKQCMEIAAGRAVEAASALNNDERKKAIEFLTEATKDN
jgi:predicted RecA/RadA family phage recombinase